MSDSIQDRNSASPVLFLASASPRRRELLEQIGVAFRVIEHGVQEVRHEGESHQEFVSRLAREKARGALDHLPADVDAVVLGSDTLVICQGEALGKPHNRRDALRMLTALSGREHQVLTAVAVMNRDRQAAVLSATNVEFRTIEVREMEDYWASGEPRDKAGAYAIQGLGSIFVSRIDGSYSGVMGLPVYETASLLVQFGIRCWQALDTTTGDQQ